MAKSIMHSKSDGCLFCGNTYTEEHHCIHGTANRKLSEKYGLKVYLCHEHHTGLSGVHFNPEMDLIVKQKAQEAFEKRYPDLGFMEIFGKNYKGENENE